MKKIIYSLFAFILFAFSSCVLERVEYTELYPDKFLKNENDVRLVVNSLYSQFIAGTWAASWGIYGPDYAGYQVMSDITTDVLWSCYPSEADEFHFQQWTAEMSGIIPNFLTNAFGHYSFLSRTQMIVKRISEVPVSEQVKQHYMAETKALRGWMALYLYDYFGPVPVAPDEVLENPQEFVYISRLTEKEYDKMMEDDMRYAIENLPVVASARGRMTKGASMMILLKYYMIRGYFDKAETLARELQEMETKGVYSLQKDYSYLFSIEGTENNELILQVPCNNSEGALSNLLSAEVLPGDYPWAEKAAGWGVYVVPWDFYATFEENDIRRKCLVTEYINKKGIKIDKTCSNQLAFGAIPVKYGKDPAMIGALSNNDLVIYRYADVLLTLAECINRNQNGPTDEAIKLVNRVRARAGLEPLAAEHIVNYEAFNEAILLERGHEFYFEGLRRQDLIRFGKYAENVNKRIDRVNAEQNRGYFRATEAHNRFFIPRFYIDESKGEIKQNPGY